MNTCKVKNPLALQVYSINDNVERSYDDAIKVIRKYPTFNNTLRLVEEAGN